MVGVRERGVRSAGGGFSCRRTPPLSVAARGTALYTDEGFSRPA